MSFSFVPGAKEILSRATEEKWPTADGLLRTTNNHPLSSQSSTPPKMSSESSSSSGKPVSVTPNDDTQTKSARNPKLQRPRIGLQRDDSGHSTSSVITAVRCNSSHSSVGGSYSSPRHPSPLQNIDHTQRSRLGRGRGSDNSRERSNEARTAATRAVAANARKQQLSEKSDISHQ